MLLELYDLCKSPPSKIIWDRFWQKVNISTYKSCWEWRGYRYDDGYGRYRRKIAHRQLMSWIYGPLGTLVSDHVVCNNRGCCNPLHIVPSTQKGNLIRPGSQARANIYRQKTQCIRGHSLTDPNNLLTAKGLRGRNCRTCHNLRRRGWGTAFIERPS